MQKTVVLLFLHLDTLPNSDSSFFFEKIIVLIASRKNIVFKPSVCMFVEDGG